MKKTMTREEMLNNIINFDRNTNTFTLTKKLFNASCKYGSEEYKFVEELKKEQCGCQIKVSESKRTTKNDGYKGLTFDYMRDYINKFDSNNNEAKNELETLIAEKANYLDIKNWFLNKYPKVKEFGTKTKANEILGKKVCKTVSAEQVEETTSEVQEEAKTTVFKIA